MNVVSIHISCVCYTHAIPVPWDADKGGLCKTSLDHIVRCCLGQQWNDRLARKLHVISGGKSTKDYWRCSLKGKREANAIWSKREKCKCHEWIKTGACWEQPTLKYSTWRPWKLRWTRKYQWEGMDRLPSGQKMEILEQAMLFMHIITTPLL